MYTEEREIEAGMDGYAPERTSGILHTLKALADETRIRILNLLVRDGDLCSCEIEAVLRLTQSNASRHLAKLRDAGLITAEKRGQWVHYRPVPEGVPAGPDPPNSPTTILLRTAIAAARREIPTLQTDEAALEAYRDSPYSCTTIGSWRGVFWKSPGNGRPGGSP
jgi:ArsR family transcriptional regulator, arsenate/arsenite/antimonite-responsive transcriptional repressor